MKIAHPTMLGLLLLAGLTAAGCSSTCPQIRSQYEQALSTESELDQAIEPAKLPTQFGLTVRTDLLNELVNSAFQNTLKASLTQLAKVDVGAGKTVGLKTAGDIVRLKVEASNACDHCFRITGDLDGAVALDIPLLGSQRAKLDGTLTLVAPLTVTARKGGGGELMLDLAQAAKIGKSSLNANLGNLPEAWSRVLKSKVSDVLLDALTRDAAPVGLLSFAGPNLGIPGMEILPSALVSDHKAGTIFLGFSTNILAMQDETPIAPITQLGQNENLALSFNPNLVAHALGLMMKKNVVPRQYGDKGQAQRGGPAHATIQAVQFAPGRVGELPMTVDFRIFNFGEKESVCYSFDATARGKIELSGQNVAVTLTQVDITDASIPGLASAAHWTQADFLRSSKTIVRESLSDKNIDIPGSSLAFKGLSINLENGAIVLRGASIPKR